MTGNHRYLVSVLLCASLWANPSCDLDTETELCPSGRRCSTGWSCAAAQDICIPDNCGDGIVNTTTGEVCDDGNVLSGDGCGGDCQSLETCGNAYGDPGEACDDGNNVSDDGCSADCLSDETCGNGYRDVDEACDDGNTVSDDGCSGDCRLETCGNGERDPGEVCDDGNTVSGDGCSSDCFSLEICGNGYVDIDEQCDDGLQDSQSCNAGDCDIPTCGDGYYNPAFVNPQTGIPEQCDDGNEIPGDGCHNCIIE